MIISEQKAKLLIKNIEIVKNPNVFDIKVIIR